MISLGKRIHSAGGLAELIVREAGRSVLVDRGKRALLFSLPYIPSSIMSNDKLKLTEESLDAFQTYYLLALEAGKILPWELDLSTMKIKNLFGLTMIFKEKVDTLDYTTWIELILPEDRIKLEPLLNDMIAGRIDNLNYDYRIITGELSNRWLKIIARTRKKNNKGKPLIIAGINQDIHEAKINELEKIRQSESLKESESRLKNAMVMGKMSPWEYDFSTGKMVTDRQMAEIWDLLEYYEKGDPIATPLLEERIHLDDRGFVVDLFDRSVKAGAGFDVQFRIIAGGLIKYIHFYCEVVSGDNGEPLKYLGLAQDITSFKKMEEKLLNHYEGFRFIANQARLGLWQFNVDTGMMSMINRHYDPITSESEYNTFHFDSLKERIHPEDFLFFESRFNNLITGAENKIEMEVRFLRGGDYRWIYIYGVVKSPLEGGSVSIEGFYQDVTDKKEIEGRLYQSQKMEAIGRLAGGVAHDFNNILQVIMGYSSLALMGIDSESEIFEYISNIVDSGEKAKVLVKQLLLFARKEKFRPGLVAPNDLLADLIRLFERVIGDHIKIDFIPDPGLHNIYADSGQLEQVIMNLCINARDAMSGTGSIIIRTENVELDESWAAVDGLIPMGNYVVVTISDTGPGIPADNIGKIFEPFFTTKGRSSGAGLGLAMVYSIIREHGGFVDVVSIEGKGTTFKIYLPVLDKPENYAEVYEDKSYTRGFIGDAAVLLAEDDEKIRSYTKKILSDAGYTVIDCSNGDEAVKLFSKMKDNIDILVFDVMMPQKNGWDAYMEIAAKRENIPVVFFSGYDENILTPHFNDSANIRYIQKPFKYFVLINAVQELVDRSKLR